jgi:hypothetical protein
MMVRARLGVSFWLIATAEVGTLARWPVAENGPKGFECDQVRGVRVPLFGPPHSGSSTRVLSKPPGNSGIPIFPVDGRLMDIAGVRDQLVRLAEVGQPGHRGDDICD